MAGGQFTSLEETPTWAVATVCFILITTSIFIEHCLHLIAKYLNKIRRMYLIQALNKIKSELMLLGFISLLLTVFERLIANICIPSRVAETFLPCSQNLTTNAAEESKCQEQGKVSLLSRRGVQELQLLMFDLAFFHVLSCFLTFSLGMAKMSKWNSWEAETKTLEYQFSNDPRRFRLIHQTSFGRRHLKCWTEHRFLRLPACFLRQFYGSVSKVDYLTLRHGFISAHFSEGSDFDFQKYIRRALEKDFGVVVGISLWIWIFLVLFIFFNAHVFHNYFWLPFIPLVMLLLVGTKLQGIITKMCLERNNESRVVIGGTLLVKPSDHFFWFGKPKLLLHLLHFILFQNSFQLAFFSWTWYKYGLRCCFHNETEDIVIRLAMALIVHILCGYVTLPLYALVTQMGTSMRNAVFTDETVDALKRWRAKARENLARKKLSYFTHPSPDLSIDNLHETTPSFSTVDASFSREEFDRRFSYDDLVASEVDEEESCAGRGREQHKKLGSFEGFRIDQ